MKLRYSILAGGAVAAAALLALSACQSTPANGPDPASAVMPASCPVNQTIFPAVSSIYGRSLAEQVDSQNFYPRVALDAGQTGNVEVCVHLNRHGTVVQGFIKQSSGFALLDGAALYAIGLLRAAPTIGSLPSQFGTDLQGAWFSLTLDYSIDRGRYSSPQAVRRFAAGDLPRLSGSPSSADSYYDFLDAEIRSQLTLPQDALLVDPYGWRRDHWQAGVRFAVHADGSIHDVRIDRSAGDSVFDGAALLSVGTVQTLGARQPVPGLAPGAEVERSLPVVWAVHLD